MGLAIELVDLRCLVEVAGLVVPPRLVEEVALTDFQCFVEGAGLAGSQRSVEEAGSAGSAMAVELLLVEQSWFPDFCRTRVRGYSTKNLFHAWAKHTHHHLLEHAHESPMMPPQHSFCRIPKRL
jgi:hypothetical protein